MSDFTETVRKSWNAQRTVSQGAGVTVIIGAGVYSLRFECATRAASVLGTRHLKTMEDGIPLLHILSEDLQDWLTKLSAKFSIAIVELVCTSRDSRFVLVWKIPASKPEKTETPSYNLDDY